MLPQLQSRIPIERSQMRLRFTVPASAAQATRDKLQSLDAVLEAQDASVQGSQVSRRWSGRLLVLAATQHSGAQACCRGAS